MIRILNGDAVGPTASNCRGQIIRRRNDAYAADLKNRKRGIDSPYLGWVSPLFWAIASVDEEMVSAILMAGADPYYAPSNHIAPITFADAIFVELQNDGNPLAADAAAIRRLIGEAIFAPRKFEKESARA